MQRFISLLFFSSLSFSTFFAQNCSNLIGYDKAMGRASTLIEQGDYIKAYQQYRAALVFCPERTGFILQQQDSLFSLIDQLREKADLAIHEKNKVLDQLYFYKGSFGIAYKEVNGKFRYGFIDKNGNEKIPFEFTRAAQFSEEKETFARVEKSNGISVLIDTSGLEVDLIKGLNFAGAWKNRYGTATGIEHHNGKISNSDFQDLTEFSNLRIIDLSRNSIKSIPDSIINLQNLLYLDLSNNEIEVLPEGLFQLKNLRVLKISNNRIKILPDAIRQLKNLSILEIDSNLLEVLPPTLGGLEFLEKLDLNFNFLRNIPDSLVGLSSLSTLSLKGNVRLDSLPSSFFRLVNLEELDLGLTRISFLPQPLNTSERYYKKLKRLSLDFIEFDMSTVPKNVEVSVAGAKNSFIGTTPVPTVLKGSQLIKSYEAARRNQISLANPIKKLLPVNTRALYLPKKYTKVIRGEDLRTSYSRESNDRNRGVIWFVYGDRNGIKTSLTYLDAQLSKANFQQISFGEVYVVIEEKGAYLHLAKDPKVSFRGVLSKDAIDMGWVHKSDLLLWNVALSEDDKSLEYPSLNISSRILCPNLLFYEDPSCSRFRPINFNKFSSHQNEFYFIYKESTNAYLVGRSARFYRQSEFPLEGWVKKSRVAEFNYNLFIEPNLDMDALNERKSAGLPFVILKTPEAAVNYARTGEMIQDQVLWEEDLKRKENSYPSEQLRFPILDLDPEEGTIKLLCSRSKGIVLDSSQGDFPFEEGYIYWNHSLLSFPYLKQMVFLSRRELANLIVGLEKTNVALTAQELRKRIHEVAIFLIHVRTRTPISSDLYQVRPAKIGVNIFDPGSSSLWASLQVKDILDPAIITDYELNKITEFLNMKAEELTRIFNSVSYQYSFSSNDITYYWIPDELLP